MKFEIIFEMNNKTAGMSYFFSPVFRMAEKKREAEAAIDLMSVQYERTRSDEEKRHGLIIENAVYGNIENDRTIEGMSRQRKFFKSKTFSKFICDFHQMHHPPARQQLHNKIK